MTSRSFLIFLLLALTFQAQGFTRYTTIHNGFASLEHSDRLQTRVEGQFLVCNNETMYDQCVTDTMRLSSRPYRYQARMNNEHNAPRKSYTVFDSNGKRSKVNSTACGIVFDMNENGTEYWAALIQCENSNLNDDMTDKRYMKVALIHHTLSHDDTIASSRLSKGVSLGSGFNSIQVEAGDGELVISVGAEELNEVFRVDHVAPSGKVKVGCLVGAGAKVKIERSVIAIPLKTLNHDVTQWTVDSLKKHFEQSSDPLEGFWIYQDRDLEEKWLRLGGRYTLAIVATASGYDIIYIDGAETRNETWEIGMLKGRMKKTIFSSHYDLMWVDATHEPITQDAYASVENGVLLTLKFPVYKSQIRLSKVLTPQD